MYLCCKNGQVKYFPLQYDDKLTNYNTNKFSFGLIFLIINLYQLILIIYIIFTCLLNFNIINSSNRLVYTLMDGMYPF